MDLISRDIAEIVDGDFFKADSAQKVQQVKQAKLGKVAAPTDGHRDAKASVFSIDTENFFDLIAEANSHRLEYQRSPLGSRVRASLLSQVPELIVTCFVRRYRATIRLDSRRRK